MAATDRENMEGRIHLPDTWGRPDINVCIVSGRLGRHPENCIIRLKTSGKRLLQIPLACRNLEWMNGKLIKTLEWYTVRIVGPKAVDNTLQWCAKGDHVLVRGRVGSYRFERDGRVDVYQYIVTFEVLSWLEKPRKMRSEVEVDATEDNAKWAAKLQKLSAEGPRPGREPDNNLWEEYGDDDIPFDTD